jgi:hypothetical protein
MALGWVLVSIGPDPIMVVDGERQARVDRDGKVVVVLADPRAGDGR